MRHGRENIDIAFHHRALCHDSHRMAKITQHLEAPPGDFMVPLARLIRVRVGADGDGCHAIAFGRKLLPQQVGGIGAGDKAGFKIKSRRQPQVGVAGARVGGRMSEAPVLAVRDLVKTFRIGFFRKKVEAVRGVSFEVRPHEIFGLLGPNGAGKTTTIKSILRLIFPTAGRVELFGKPVERSSMERIGYMPENPYVYQYLRPTEFLDLCGRLMGMDRTERRERADEMIARVGLDHARDRPIGKFSKGMMQRVGLAQALLHDPEVLILDEPMSGLDPIGRKEIRDLLLEQKRAGKTLVFTSHILSDVEVLCDRVVILQHGKIAAQGKLSELLSDAHEVEVELRDVPDALVARLAEMGLDLHQAESRWLVTVPEGRHEEVVRAALELGAHLVAVRPQRENLESLFVQRTRGDEEE